MPKVENKQYCDVKRVTIRQISKTIAEDIIVKYHYTHNFSSCRYALGIYYKEENESTFGDEQLIGCVIYGHPVGAKAATSICEGLTKDNALELTRLFVHDGYGSNIESFSLAQSFKWLKEHDTDIKLLISYADSGQMHLGGIYQATNWIYQGKTSDIALMPNFDISVQKDPFDWIHSRTVSSRWKSNNLEHLKRVIGKEGYTEFWRRKASDKHRYIQILASNKKERKDLFSRLKHSVLPYPKNAEDFLSNIELHLTYPPEDDIKTNFW